MVILFILDLMFKISILSGLAQPNLKYDRLTLAFPGMFIDI